MQKLVAIASLVVLAAVTAPQAQAAIAVEMQTFDAEGFEGGEWPVIVYLHIFPRGPAQSFQLDLGCQGSMQVDMEELHEVPSWLRPAPSPAWQPPSSTLIATRLPERPADPCDDSAWELARRVMQGVAA
jgi:hypothetical protein